MGLTDREREWAQRVSRFIKAELKRVGVSYKELARRLNEHGLEETEGLNHVQAWTRNLRCDVFPGYLDGAGYGGGSARGFIDDLKELALQIC